MGAQENRPPGSPGPLPSGQRDPERLAECTAQLLKYCGIYPASHPRVIERAETFAAEVERWIEAPNWVAVRIRGDALAVQRTVLTTKSPLVQWMIGRLREAGLAGVEFGPKLDAGTAIEFARSLATCSARNGRSFSTVWPANHTRLRPLDLVFAGRHGNATAASESGQESTAVGTAAQDAWKPDLVARLAAQDGVVARLRSIESTAAQVAAPSGNQATASIDLVSSIVDLLPVEVAADAGRVDAVVTEVLDAMQMSLTRVLRDGGEVNDADLLRTALGVAKKYFGKSAGDVEIKKELPTGRPEDERIAADLDLLLAEVADLPDARGLALPAAAACEATAPDLAAELCGIYLHVLQHTERPESLAALAGCLPKALAALGPNAFPILDRYLKKDPGAFAEPSSKEARLRLLTFLERAGLGELLCARGYCDTDLLARTYPESLPVFARLRGQTPEGIDDLRTALSTTGATQLAAGAEHLRTAGALAEAAVVDAVVAVGGPLVLPLVQRMLAAEDARTRTAVVGYLRTLQLPDAESAALRFIEPASELPVRYLEDLFRIAADHCECDPRTRQQSSYLLRVFVLDPRRRLERRLAGIFGLRHLPGPETRTALGKLALEGRFTQFGAGQRALRRQAREVLQWLDQQGTK